MVNRSPDNSKDTAPTGHLRVMETTDLHMQLLNYDYFADQRDDSIGLVGLADHIDRLRKAPGVATLLFDNGDLIQGNPLADYLAATLPPHETHPMIAALNVLDYDAMTLGNHEFDYGLTFLRNVLRDSGFGIVSANITNTSVPALAKPFVILKRAINCDDGITRAIKIGVTGFCPPQVADWGDKRGNVGITVGDIIETAQETVPQMRAAGADLTIALCHSGIRAHDYLPRMENAAVPLAAVDGIDVILTGHTHEAFPDRRHPKSGNVDYANGTLHGKPTVMAGYCGKSLGVIDLRLRWHSGRWDIADHKVHLVPAKAPPKNSVWRDRLNALAAPYHATAIAQMQEPIAKTAIPIHSYFATILPDLSQQLLARATQEAIQLALHDTEHSHLPVLAAKSSFRFGGRSGLGHYIDIPKGEITLRDAAAIFPFADKLCAVRRTGADIKRWLERSAAHYNQIQRNQLGQPLINPKSIGYNCDTIFGLSYEIDLTQPAGFDTEGNETTHSAHRIKKLRYKGTPVQDSDVFVVATNSFRANGGGGFPHVPQKDILHTAQRPIRQILIDYLKHQGTITEPVVPTWAFAAIEGASGSFESAPKARVHMQAPITYIGAGQAGFDSYQIIF